ncbi:ATP-binding cassette sub-family A member 10-like [Rana temporaria]|uniref:ATP-binding cassette sub-family A member 10-like n=1 Tax=Rana temporaria TaxID=8407 RepID=UPI001AAC4EE0|nr:ATP-binding cassette sub-family A member 10-like [Rana temporaria]
MNTIESMTGEAQREVSLIQQTLALLRKNILVQWRRLGYVILEWLQHLALVLLLFFFIDESQFMKPQAWNSYSPARVLGSLNHLENLNFSLNVSVFPSQVGYFPGSPTIREIMQLVNRSTILPGILVEEYENATDVTSPKWKYHLGTVVFSENEFNYSLRFPYKYHTDPNDYTAMRGSCGDHLTYCHSLQYLSEGFLSLQATIDSAIVEHFTNQSIWESMETMTVVKMKSVTLGDRSTLHMCYYTFLLSVCFVSLSYVMTLHITQERRKTRELMRMMGVKDLAFWLSWVVLYSLSAIIIAVLITLVATTYVFVKSSFGVIFLLFCLYGIATVCFNCMLSALLRKHHLTAISGFFITVFLSALGILPLLKVIPTSLEVFLSLFHPFSFAVGITSGMHMENDLQGSFFSDITGDSFHILSSIIYLIIDSVLYILLTLYFDKIIPDKHGLRHEPLFFLRSSFWLKKKKTPITPGEKGRAEPDSEDYAEKVPADLLGKDVIRIFNVKKMYSGKDDKTEALRGLDLNVYEGQITALLGHNGAGKTTLLNILSGMGGATSGSATIYNYQLSDFNHRLEIQRKIGFCPQFDVNFDLLTVKENLEVFANIKGIPKRKIKSQVETVLSDLAMVDLQHLQAGKLSGGQRRKLTLAIALLGDPEVLLLDEPTSGLDPSSRHRVWSVLKERKAGHVTLFSTQFMDEADILADRKAVLSKGRLKCVGSSLFLKRKWGIGYHLRMQVTPSCDTEAITSLITQHVSNAKLSTQNVEDVTFTLPFEDIDTFPALFSDLEGHVGREIVSYGVSITTLDDVFLKLEGKDEIEKGDYGVFAQEPNEEQNRDHFSSEPEDSTLLMSDSGTPTISGMALWRQQVLAVARIRYLKLIHNMQSFRSMLLLLALFILPMVTVIILTKVSYSYQAWEMTPHLYFRRAGEREHKFYTKLLVNNNTGVPIDNFLYGVTAQDFAVDVVDGPYDMDNTTEYNGAIEVTRDDKGYGFRIIGNPRAHNILPVLVNIISNALLRLYNSPERIRVWNDPVHQEEMYFTPVFHYAMILLLLFASGLAPHFAMSSMEDVKIKVRSQMRLFGLFPSAYWCGQVLVDVALYWLVLFLINTTIYVIYPKLNPLWELWLLIMETLGYGMAVVLNVYVIASLLGKKKIQNDRWSFLFILSSLIPLVIEAFTPYIDGGTRTFYFIVLFLLPPTNLIGYYVQLTMHHYMKTEQSERDLYIHPIFPYLQIVTFGGLLWFLEWKFGTRSLKRDPMFRFTKREHPFTQNPEQLDDADEEVLAERERVNTLKTTHQEEESPAILVDALRKEFEERSGVSKCFGRKKKRTAIRNTSFCVKKGEVLGLLGPNGAGKTTSVLILAGEMKPTAGQVVLGNAGDSSTLGYCPQHNSLWPNLTVKEHLEISAAIKGMNKEDTDRAIKRVAEALELRDHLQKPTRRLSAGVSRKVCFAISMLGNPTIVLLDEPSTGLDPKGQQRLWRAIRAAFKNNERGAILTTHYMEEAEAVCDRVAIMVSGTLRCIGSIQHLKSKYGKGYLLEIKLKDTQQIDVIHQEVLRLFPQATKKDRFSSLLVYNIPMDNVQSLSQAFLQLEKAKKTYNIEEYSFSQATLQQVFLELAKEQEKEDFHLESSFGWRQLSSEDI